MNDDSRQKCGIDTLIEEALRNKGAAIFTTERELNRAGAFRYEKFAAVQSLPDLEVDDPEERKARVKIGLAQASESWALYVDRMVANEDLGTFSSIHARDPIDHVRLGVRNLAGDRRWLRWIVGKLFRKPRMVRYDVFWKIVHPDGRPARREPGDRSFVRFEVTTHLEEDRGA